LTDPLTFALVACALCAAVAYVDFEDSIFIDASIVPLLLAAIFVGPLATFAVVIAAEAGAWARQRYRISAALINALATGAPSVIAALIFERVETRTGTGFYVAIAAVSAGALILNFVILVPLISLLDRRPLTAGFSHVLRVFPAFALNVVLVIAAANVYVNVGLAAVVFVLAVILAFTYLVAQVFRAREQTIRVAHLASSRQHLAAQVLNAENRERRRLASALHDGPVQDLLTARQDLHEGATPDHQTSARLDRVLGHALDQLRDVVAELHPAVLERRGIGVALKAVAREQAQRTGLVVDINIDVRVASSRSGLTYTIARELITNAGRHACAKHLRIRLAPTMNALLIEVEDDGVGLTLARRRDALADGHIGLASIEDRVEAVGGTFSVENTPGGGTTCRVVLPLEEPAKGRTSSLELPPESLEGTAGARPSLRDYQDRGLTRVGED
jgi:signal transduction histidine kinase